MINTPLLTPRIEACLRAGCVEDLEPVLAGWPRAELKALERELRASYEAARVHLEDRYRESVFRPGRKLKPADLEEIHAGYQRAASGLVEMYQEMLSVVYRNLARKETVQ